MQVSDPKKTSFRPRWWSDRDAPTEAGPLAGSVPQGPPRIHTRLLLGEPTHGVSAKTLGETLQFAGCDLVHGVNPDFADLRSAGADVLKLCKLTIEPFETGSFVVPARLESTEVPAAQAGPARTVSTEDVVRRFEAILSAFERPEPVTEVSIGAIQALEALGRVIRREAGAIEFTPFDTLCRPMKAIRVTPQTVERVARVREARRPSQSQLEMLEGRITALDIVEYKLQINVEPGGGRVRGTFSGLFQPSLVGCLGRRVRFLGIVERRGKRPIAIQVQSVEIPDEEL